MKEFILLLSAIVVILLAIPNFIKFIVKYSKLLRSWLKQNINKIKVKQEYNRRVRYKKINARDYEEIKKKVEKGIATNLERDAFYTFQKENPLTKVKLPDNLFEQAGKDLLARQALKVPMFDINKYIKK